MYRSVTIDAAVARRFSRRASVRVKSELTSAIYDKSLRRKDGSGVADAKESSGTAGVGKIVNLMAVCADLSWTDSIRSKF